MTAVNESLAATNLRIDLEERVMPSVGRILGSTLEGNPIPGCLHMGNPERQGTASLYIVSPFVACAVCAGARLAEGTQFQCAVCGLSDKASDYTLRLWGPAIVLGVPILLELPEGEVIAWISRNFVTLPVAAECAAHDGTLDSHAELYWSPKVVDNNGEV